MQPSMMRSAPFSRRHNHQRSAGPSSSLHAETLRLHLSDRAEERADRFSDYKETNLELLRLFRKRDGVNFVSRTAKNNGVAARVAPLLDMSPSPGGVLSVAAGGSVLETFVQFDPFYSGRDLFVLTPKHPMMPEELMFYANCIRANQWRYSYGRQANRTLKELLILDRKSVPNWVYESFTRVADQLIQTVHA
jgi:hypothetical protein